MSRYSRILTRRKKNSELRSVLGVLYRLASLSGESPLPATGRHNFGNPSSRWHYLPPTCSQPWLSQKPLDRSRPRFWHLGDSDTSSFAQEKRNVGQVSNLPYHSPQDYPHFCRHSRIGSSSGSLLASSVIQAYCTVPFLSTTKAERFATPRKPSRVS